MAAWISFKGISCCNLLPHVPSGCLRRINSNPCPGTDSQSLYSSSHPPQILKDPPPYPGWVRLCASHSIQTVIDQLLYSPTVSDASPPSQIFYYDVGISPLLQFLHPLGAGQVAFTLSSFFLPSFLPSFLLSSFVWIYIESFLVVRNSY